MSLVLLPALLLLGTPPQTQPAPVTPTERIVPPPVVPTLPTAKPSHAKGDPLENFNRRMFRTQQGFDRKFFRPVALGYKHALPRSLRSGIRNFFGNLREPIVFLNYLLQLKPGKAAETLGRFVINSTAGVAGLIDVAKSKGVNLPHRPNGFGDTLGFYGVKPGPYLFLPFVGPSTLRDLFGGQGDGLVLPIAVGTPFDRLEYQIPRGVLVGLDTRAEADDDLRALFDGAVDPYATLRSVYLQNRAAEILQLKGARAAKAGDTPFDDPLDDPAGASASPAQTAPELSVPLADPAAPTTAAPAPELSDPLTDPASSTPSP